MKQTKIDSIQAAMEAAGLRDVQVCTANGVSIYGEYLGHTVRASNHSVGGRRALLANTHYLSTDRPPAYIAAYCRQLVADLDAAASPEAQAALAARDAEKAAQRVADMRRHAEKVAAKKERARARKARVAQAYSDLHHRKGQ